MSEQTWRWGPAPPDDGITLEELRPHGWAPGKYTGRCQKCSERYWDAVKRSRKCRPCAVASFKAVQAVRAGAPLPADRAAPVERAFWETPREVTHEEAEAAARRLVNSHFRNPDSARVSIPANPNRDDDLVLLSYIAQRARAGDPQAAAALAEIKA